MPIFFDLGDTLGQAVISTQGRLAGLVPFDYVEEVLASLTARGLRLGIISNTADDSGSDVDAILRQVGLLPFFPEQQLRIYSKDVGVSKPSPEIYLRAAAAAGLAVDFTSQRVEVPPGSHCLFVGEDAVERTAAVAVGFRVAPHPLLVEDALSRRHMSYIAVQPTADTRDGNWRARLRDLGSFVPVHHSRLLDRVYGIASHKLRSALLADGFAVDTLGDADAPLTSDLYLLRDDPPPEDATNALESRPRPRPSQHFFVGEFAQALVTRTDEGVFAIVPSTVSVERIHFDGAYHGHNLKLLPNIHLLLDERDTGLEFVADLRTRSLTDTEVSAVGQITSAQMISLIGRLSGHLPFDASSGREVESRHIHHRDNKWVVHELAKELESIGNGALQVRLLPFTHEGTTFHNIEAELRGTSTELVLLSAHLDSTAANESDYDSHRDTAPGADDDASGVAAVLCAARICTQLSSTGPPACTIRFVLFNAEEHGLVGSKAYAKGQRSQRADIKAVLQMDMIGHARLRNSWELHAGFGASRAVEAESIQVAQVVRSVTDLVADELRPPQIYTTDSTPPDPAEGRSDHAAFHEVGYPALVASEDFFVGPHAHSPAPDPNRAYHMSGDVVEDSSGRMLINGDYASAIARTITATAWLLANPGDPRDELRMSRATHFAAHGTSSIGKDTAMSDNGLRRVSFVPTAGLESAGDFAASSGSVAGLESTLPSETFSAAAHRYLRRAFSRPDVFGLETGPGESPAALPEFHEVSIEEEPLAQSTVADYAQEYRGVPLYGTRVSVEMDDGRNLLAISGEWAPEPTGSPIAQLSPRDALGIIKEMAGKRSYEQLEGVSAPRLVYRFSPQSKAWVLSYHFQGVRIFEGEQESHEDSDQGAHQHEHLPGLYSVFLDANTGEEICRVPTSKNSRPVNATGRDADETVHNFIALEEQPNRVVLEDPGRRIKTFTMGFNDIFCGSKELPGDSVESTSTTFTHPSAVVAHSNATQVFDFFATVLQRNGIDGRGGEIISAVDCLEYRATRLGCLPRDPSRQTWKNAAWVRDASSTASVIRNGLMVYGQTRWSDGRLHSFAESLDVVGHELTHGVTDHTSDLEYVTESGALNESYSDIIGIAISNSGRPNIAAWDWELGEELSSNGSPTRDLQNPRRFGQPDHMRDMLRLRAGELPSRDNDHGFVHTNSGIHNRAAFNLFQRTEFTWQEVVQLFYLTLTRRLSRTSGFRDSLLGMLSSCQVMFRQRPDLANRLQAIRSAFDAVGIQE